MNSTRWIAGIGVILLIGGISLLMMSAISAAPVQAQSQGGDYLGADECESCHRDVARAHQDSNHALTLTDDEDAILADFDAGEDLRQVQPPGEDAARAFTAEDVAFVVGTGRHVQYYLYKVDRNDYRVLPAGWDAVAGEWHLLDLGETWDSPGFDWEQNCAYCHVTGYDAERGRWTDDGVTCEACHGPGEEHEELASDAGRRPSDDELVEIRAAINPAIDPQICGQCHGRGVSASEVPFPVGYFPGGDLSTDFALTPVDDAAHWWTNEHARLPNMQYNEWLDSGHAHALTGLLESGLEIEPSCLTCHSTDYNYTQGVIAQIEAGEREGEAPEALTVETAQYGVACVTCHDPHLETDRPVHLRDEPLNLCAGCHSTSAALPEVHFPAFEMVEGRDLIPGVGGIPDVHFTAEEGPNCITCHMPNLPTNGGMRASHGFEPVLPRPLAEGEGLIDTCSECHASDVDPAIMGMYVADMQAGTQRWLEGARAAVTEDTPAWVIDGLDFIEQDRSYGLHNPNYVSALVGAIDSYLNSAAQPVTQTGG
ncbi:MAG: hypothetical protein L6Q98_18150 [Anaerolineae bacterium]|nr:hypothetical protein [Anaerolineae bacterium]NUQ06744.1 hypothetical protein [Anaerolineae bacterium]